MITLKLPINLAEEDKIFIKELQQKQSPTIRSAYKSASFGLAEISVREELRNRFKNSELDSWFQQSAVKLGIGNFKADKELGIEKRIFGGKKNFVRRTKGLISNEEWKECRLLPIYLIGESPAGGNRKFKFGIDKIIFKPWKKKQVEICLPKLNKNWSKLWESAILLASQNLLPITVSLTPEFICLSFDDIKIKESIKKRKTIKNRYAGIDLNPNYIGVSVFDSGKLISTKLIDLKELTGKNKSESKISHETYEIGHDVGNYLKHLKVDKVFIEELKFKQGDKGLGKNFNRLTQNQWKKEKFKAALTKYFPKSIYSINAAYTSTIGNVLNPHLPDPIAASTAIAERGFEIVVKKSKKFYPELPTSKELEDRWKETEFPVFSSWIEIHRFIKNSGLKYRVPIPEREGFRKFKSTKSSVYIIDNFEYN